MGWATWLGPEYEELLKLPGDGGFVVERMPDGGRLIVCGHPEDARVVSNPILAIYENIVRSLDRAVFQNDMGLIPLLPTFRFRESSVGTRPGGIHSKEGGFTMFSEIQKILARRERPFLEDGTRNGVGGVFKFSGLLPAEAEQLLSLLPPTQQHDSLESSPSFGEMVAFGRRFPFVRFTGYRVASERSDERITIDGFEAPEDKIPVGFLEDVRLLNPDRMDWIERDGTKVIHAWWD